MYVCHRGFRRYAILSANTKDKCLKFLVKIHVTQSNFRCNVEGNFFQASIEDRCPKNG